MSHENLTAGEPAPRAKPRVAVLFGGRSSEHAVSCVTAAGVLGAINKDKYEVIPIGIAKTGQWVLASADTAQWSLAASSLPEVAPSPQTVTLAEIGGEHQLIVASPNEVPQELGTVDVVFPLLHGPFGEDGTIQGLLELSDTRYVGAGVLASAVGMDKHFMKVVFEAAGLHVGPYIAVTDRQWRKDPESVRKQVDRLGFPVFVKPARAGSSMGISKVDSLEELDAAIEEARRHDLKLVIEAGITGREIECAVLEGTRAPTHAADLHARRDLSGWRNPRVLRLQRQVRGGRRRLAELPGRHPRGSHRPGPRAGRGGVRCRGGRGPEPGGLLLHAGRAN